MSECLMICGWEIVSKKKELNSLLFCTTCGNIAINPVNADCKKGSSYCHTCAYSNTTCPQCKEVLHFTENFFVSGLLDEVQVYCVNKKHGCKWTGKKGNGMNHLDNECSYFICSGKDNGCIWKGKKNNLSKHEIECGFIEINCPNNCSKNILRKNIDSHRNECKVVIEERNNEDKRKIEEKKNNYQQQMKETEEQRKTIQQNVKIVFSEKVHPKKENNIVLNVRGKIINTSKSTLMNERSSPFFETILNNNKNINNNNDNINQQIIIDRNPKIFSLIMDYIDFGSSYPEDIKIRELSMLLVESIFWCIKDLAEEIMNVFEMKKKICKVNYLNVSGYDFTFWNFKSIQFNECIFEHCNFDNSTFNNINFIKCDFNGTTMKNSSFKTSNLSGNDISFVDLFGITFNDCDLNHTKLPSSLIQCKIIQTNLSNVNLSNCDLSFSNLSNISLDNLDLSHCNLSNVNLPNEMDNCNLSDCILDNTILPNILKHSNLSRCCLRNTDLSYCKFIKCDLSDCITDNDILPKNSAIRTKSSIIALFTGTLSISKEGNVYSFGMNENGKLGHKESNIFPPKVIPKLKQIKSIDCYFKHSVCLDIDGNVYTFGDNEYGQLGIGKDKLNFTHIPQKVNIPSCKQISCGYNHTVCLSEDGFVYSFGYNYHGQLGVGNNTNYDSPQKIESLKDIEFIECGANHVFCKTLNNEIYCWGNSNSGQLGHENNDNQNTPILCSSLSNEDVIDIKCGNRHTLVLISNGDVLSCGFNSYGQLGRVTDKSYSSSFQEIENLSEITRIECGYSHSICVDVANDLYLFGCNGNGQLGLGDTENRYKPIKHPSLSNIIDISKRGNHTFIKTSNNEIYTFGNNQCSQLGIETKHKKQITPIRVFEDNEDIWF